MTQDALIAIATAPGPEAAVARFIAESTAQGFPHAAAGGWVGVATARAHRFYFNTWPEAWTRAYAERGLFASDPVVAHARTTRTAFLMTETETTLRASPGGADTVDAARAFGWAEVMAVPIHGPGGYQGLITLTSPVPVTMTAGAVVWLAALAYAVHDRCHDAPGFGARMPPAPVLSARQIAVLRGVAAGLTDKEIGRDLGLSPATAHYHVEAAKRALGARTRAEAVAICALDGIL
jgi:LuxR family quorum sensing-dependent transcriptional regulator